MCCLNIIKIHLTLKHNELYPFQSIQYMSFFNKFERIDKRKEFKCAKKDNSKKWQTYAFPEGAEINSRKDMALYNLLA